MIGTLPSCHLPSKKVQLGEYSMGFLISAMTGLSLGVVPHYSATIGRNF
ncbi:hypothetical protein ACVWZV_002052 [Bradyrhizobium sp. GM5.1]|jgi:hypothetical protein